MAETVVELADAKSKLGFGLKVVFVLKIDAHPSERYRELVAQTRRFLS